jgi:NAD(P)H-hydrate epimerase
MNNIVTESVVVSAAQMQEIESGIFAAGMPVAALMEKAALLTANRIRQLYPPCSVGALVGPGHNGGDALVIARELHLQGYQVTVYCPFSQLKELTSQHSNYAKNLGIVFVENLELLSESELIIDGFFGFGLTRNLEGDIANIINTVNQWKKPVVSIDIPSGIHTDTGEVLGTAICASHSLCLGLWKLAYFQDQALPYLGKVERIDFGIPSWEGGWGEIKIFTETMAQQFLPLPRPLVTHKYQQGHLLLICGSNRYAGGAVLTALGARASGVGMLSVAVPKSLKPLLVSHLPEALIIECPETETGAIAQLPELNLNKYDVIACGPGITLEAKTVVEYILEANIPLVLDADALNIIAENHFWTTGKKRNAPTVLTPHLGEFKRLFPHIINPEKDRINAVIEASRSSNTIVLFKGSRTAIAGNNQIYLIPESTPALARGGSGDTLTGLMGGLMAQKRQNSDTFTGIVALAAWWHAQAGILAVSERTELGVDAYTLSQYLGQILKHQKIK